MYMHLWCTCTLCVLYMYMYLYMHLWCTCTCTVHVPLGTIPSHLPSVLNSSLVIYCCISSTPSISELVEAMSVRWAESRSRVDTLHLCLKQAEELVTMDTSTLLKPTDQLQRYVCCPLDLQTDRQPQTDRQTDRHRQTDNWVQGMVQSVDPDNELSCMNHDWHICIRNQMVDRDRKSVV